MNNCNMNFHLLLSESSQKKSDSQSQKIVRVYLPWLFNYFTPPRSLRAVYWTRALVYENSYAKKIIGRVELRGGGKVTEQSR